MIQVNDVFPDINPAFCSLVLTSFCKGHHEESKCGSDYASLLLVLPITISKDFEHFFYKKQKKSDFFQLINQHPDILISIQDRIKGTLPITQQAMCFALKKGLLKLSDSKRFILSERASATFESRAISSRVRKYLNYADMLGVWLGRINSPETIFSYIGAIRS